MPGAFPPPSGFDNSDLPTCISTSTILSLGATKTGILGPDLRGYLLSTSETRDLRVADIGIPAAAWKRFGKKNVSSQVFGTQWVVGVDFMDESGRAEEGDAYVEGEDADVRVVNVVRERRGGRGVRGMRVGRARRGLVGRGM